MMVSTYYFGRESRMAKLIFRSICVGIASVALAAFVGGFIALSLFAMNTSPSTSDQQTGYDSFFITRNDLMLAIGVLLVVFAAGFALGFRFFSKLRQRQGT